MCGLSAFLVAKKEEISTLANLASIVGILLTVGALVFAGYQLQLTNVQLEAGKKALEAQTVFNIQGDGRELLRALFEDQDFENYLYTFDSNKTFDDKIVIESNNKIRVLLQFYSTVFNQKRAGAISEKFWGPFGTEICNFARLPAVREYWGKASSASSFSSDFRGLLSKC